MRGGSWVDLESMGGSLVDLRWILNFGWILCGSGKLGANWGVDLGWIVQFVWLQGWILKLV